MNNFDHRWQALVTAARQAPAHRAPLSDLHAARFAATFAAKGLAAAQRQREAERAWRGMAMAAGLFLACLIGLGAAAQAFVPPDTLRHALTFGRPDVPDTLFIPAPPHPPALATLASSVPQWSPVRVLDALGDWFAPTPSALEKSP